MCVSPVACSNVSYHKHACLHASMYTSVCTCVYCFPLCTCAFPSFSLCRKEELRVHRHTHESSKLYQCPLCHCGYSTAVALTNHLVTHQDLEGASAFSSSANDRSACIHCGQSFETTQLLQEHMSIHSAVIKVG